MRQTLLYCSFLFLLLAPVASLAQNPHGEINVDLPALYKQIDEAVEKSPQYIAEYEQNINKKKKILRQTDNDEQLRATKEDLEKANKELAQFNSKLEWMNKQITKYNKQLMEMNKSQSS